MLWFTLARGGGQSSSGLSLRRGWGGEPQRLLDAPIYRDELYPRLTKAYLVKDNLR